MNNSVVLTHRFHPYLAVLTLIAFVFLLGSSALASSAVLVDRGEPKFVIVTSPNPSSATNEAVQELNYWINRITGVSLPVVTEDRWDGSTPYIAVGPGRLVSENGWDRGEFQQEEARVIVLADRIGLIGNDTSPYPGVSWKGTYYAVLEFVKKSLGVRWIWPGELGEVFVSRSTLVVDEDIWAWAPQLTLTRQIRNGPNPTNYSNQAQELFGFMSIQPQARRAMDQLFQDQSVWLNRQRMNRSSDVRFGHAFTNWWSRFGQEHPDWFALPPDGAIQTGGRGVKLNLSNPEVHDQVVKDWRQSWESNPASNRVLSIAPNDSRGFDTRPETRAWDHSELDHFTDRQIWNSSEPVLSDRYLKFWNIIARRVKEIAPDAVVTTYAYRNYRQPPIGNERVEDNIIIGYVGGEGYYPDESFIRDEWAGWAQRGATLSWRPNLLHAGHGVPYLYSRQLYEDFRFFLNNNMLGTDFDSLTGNWSGQGLNYYVVAELHSRPEATYEELVNEYYSAFGPARQAIRAYHEFFEEETRKLPQIMRQADLVSHETWGGWWIAHIRIIPLFLTPEVIARGETLLRQAQAAVVDDDPIYQERVNVIRAGFDHAKLMAETFRELRVQNPFALVSYNNEKTHETLQPLWEFRKRLSSHYLLPLVRYLVEEENRLGIWSTFRGKPAPEIVATPPVGTGTEWLMPFKEGWMFRADPRNEGRSLGWNEPDMTAEEWEPIVVGIPWRRALPDVEESQIGWYRLEFDMPSKEKSGQRLLLLFGSVDAEMHLWVNGQLVNERGYPHNANYDSWLEPFWVDVTNAVSNEQENVIVVRVESEQAGAGITGAVSLLVQEWEESSVQ